MTPFQAVQASSPLPNGLKPPPLPAQQNLSNPNHLAPEDAFVAPLLARQQHDAAVHVRSNGSTLNGELANARAGNSTIARRPRHKERGRSGSRRRKGVWKKLLWVKQPYPDNYTDPPSFLSHLQRNPRLLPYDFWPLVADSTVIVQHICSVAIFICCFVGIFQERVSPVSVVNWGTAGTVLGWLLWDFWVGKEEAVKALLETTNTSHGDAEGWDADNASSAASSLGSTTPIGGGPVPQPDGLGLTFSPSNSSTRHSPSPSHSHPHSHSRSPSSTSLPALTPSGHPTGAANFATYSTYPPLNSPHRALSPRNQQRLATAKSAILIYSALLGLSPILKSLTKSTTSDSIWAMSCWLMCINVFFFDYGGGVGVHFPASLSTNAALMASTVLASRLPSTTHVFSLTLFSIEVFGLFPVFRRHLRHISWRGHLLLTFCLTVAAGAGMGVVLASETGVWKAGVAGVVLWGVGTAVGMGGCSWWLIGLQKYKNVVIGPWDPARPVLRGGHWD